MGVLVEMVGVLLIDVGQVVVVYCEKIYCLVVELVVSLFSVKVLYYVDWMVIFWQVKDIGCDMLVCYYSGKILFDLLFIVECCNVFYCKFDDNVVDMV